MTHEKEIEAKVNEVLPDIDSGYSTDTHYGYLMAIDKIKQAILSGRLWLPVSEEEIKEIVRKECDIEGDYLNDSSVGVKVKDLVTALHKLLRGE